MKPEFTLEQIREFVKKGYTSVAARMTKDALIYLDQNLVKLQPGIPTVSVEGTDLEKALTLLRDLADLQNGPPLERHRAEWEQTMQQVYDYLNTHEGKK
jgi:hypothetical protein